MTSKMKFDLSVFCLINVITVVKSGQLDIRPSTNIQVGEPTLTVRCQPTSAFSSVYRLGISREREGVSFEQSLGSIAVTEQPILGPGLTSPKYTVTGSLTSISAVSTSFLQIVIQDPDCNDKGEYICSVSGANSGGSLNTEDRTNVTIQDNPSSLLMNVVPRKSQYTLNDSISLSCNGNVGNPPRTWQWQTRRFPASTQWITYTDESDIVTDPVTPPSGTRCSYRQQTDLTYRVKAQDDGLEIRCILDNREEFSQNVTIYMYIVPSIESTVPPKIVKSQAQLDITPTLTVRCQPSTASGVTSVVRLDISRKREGESTEMVLGKIVNGKQPELGPGLTNPKYTVTGSTDPVSTSFLQIVIQKPNSNDKGEYGCKVKASGSSGITYSFERKHSVNVQGSVGESNRNAVVKSAQLDITPSTNVQAGEPTLTVRCQPTTASDVTSVYRLDISKRREGVNTEQNLGSIQVTEQQPELGPGFTSPKYTVTGSLTSVDAVSTSFLQIVIQDPDCNDKGEYICKVTGGNNEGPLYPEKQTNVTIQENPSSLLVNVVPRRNEYKLNDLISMSCNVNVGNPPRTWQWQTRRFPASTQWIRYTDESDIVTDPVTPPSGTICSYRQQTVLNYTVKFQDDGLEFRCILDNREEFSPIFTVNLSSGDYDDRNAGSGDDDDRNAGSVMFLHSAAFFHLILYYVY